MLEAGYLAVETSDDRLDRSAGLERCPISEIIILVGRNDCGGLQLLQALPSGATVAQRPQVVSTLHNESFLAYGLPELGRVADPQVTPHTELILSLKVIIIHGHSLVGMSYMYHTYVGSGCFVAQGRLVESLIVLILTLKLAVLRILPFRGHYTCV